MPLSDTAVRQARASGKAYTLGDSRGLALAIAASGSKSWHFRYLWLGKQKRMSLGTYPEVSLKDARIRRDAARALVAKGINPQKHRKQEQLVRQLTAEQTFQAVFEKWLEYRRLSLKSGRQSSLEQLQQIFHNDVLPVIGKCSVYDVTRTDLVQVLAGIEDRKAFSVAQKCRLWLKQFFRFAMVKIPGLERNPALDLEAVAQPRPPVIHNPYVRFEDLPLVLQSLRDFHGKPQTRMGLRLLLLTGVRTGELRSATPDQFDLERGFWVIPAVIVKQLQVAIRKQGKRPQDVPPYVVPLSDQAIQIIRHLLGKMRSGQRYLLAHRDNLKKPISENTLNQALKSLGFEGQLTGHGIRATITTALNEFGYPKVWIDAQLSHTSSQGGGEAYNHAEYVEPRRKMMQDWANRIDLLEVGNIGKASAPLVGQVNDSPGDQMGQNTSAIRLEGNATVIMTFSSADLAKVFSAFSTSFLPERSASTLDAKGIEAYNSSNNLPLSAFAKLACRPCEQVMQDIKSGRLLALFNGDMGYRVPVWQIEQTKYLLTLMVMTHTDRIDDLAIYSALSKPMAHFGGLSPLEVVTSDTIIEISDIVCRGLAGREC
ncbi:tyrosine-type recombinase/integrase [Pseudomonas aeruginosa]|uniref:tyrosine-type recombinase/integrase n=1 Tax=Pseudomonas aeruginosa TaxID=287 RepID=UPI0009A3F8B1|nr:integrase arm-type DNA-binding domain-containing protein [Pseudomonas aeruginosa]